MGSRADATNGRIRLLYSIDTMGIGGTELNAIRTAELLNRSRFELSVVCLKDPGPLSTRYQAAHIPVTYLGLRNLYGKTALAGASRLVDIMREDRYHVVHSHDMYSNIFTTACARFAGLKGIIASQRWSSSLPETRYRIGNRIAFRHVNRVLVNAPATGAAVAREAKLPAGRIAVISNFVTEDAFTPMSETERAERRKGLGLPLDAPVVGIVARLSTVKDHATLFRAFARVRERVPTARLVVVGDGPLQGDLDRLAGELGVGGIVFAGHRADAARMHGIFDVSVLCSLSEGFPNSIVEAMAAGRPVVATAVGGNVDAVIQDETGLLVPVGAPEPLAGAIAEILTDTPLRTRMGINALAEARARYHVDSVMPELERLYQSVANVIF